MTTATTTAAALIIGNELLSGKIADENLIVLARELRSMGIKLRRFCDGTRFRYVFY